MIGKKRYRPDFDLPYTPPKQRASAAMVQRLNQQGLIPYGNNYKKRMAFRKSRGKPQEIKYFDHGVDATAITNAATATTPAYYQTNTIVGINRGDAANERVGNKINIKSIDIRGLIGLPRQSSTSDTTANWAGGPSQWRILVYQDMQCNGAVAPINSILDLTLTNANPSNAYNNLQYSGRFKILMDKFMTLEPGAAVFNSATSHYVTTGSAKFFKKHIICDIPITYLGESNSLTNITTNNVGILFICNNNYHELVQYRTRVRYSD